MKEKCLSLLLVLSIIALPVGKTRICNAAQEEVPKLAIVIDDFGADRRGVQEMLDINAPLTIAVMPGCEFSTIDAESAHARGHEVILHMPMENQSQMPAEYYGPIMIKNTFSESEAVETLKGAIDSIPYAVGVNIHMGTGVSRNKKLMTAMMGEVKSRNMLFLDSRTIEGSVCDECAELTGVKFLGRDAFLEPPGRPNYHTAIKELLRAATLAKTNGKAVAIGHVGPVGDNLTAKAIADTLEEIEKMGVQIVPLSALVS